PPRNDCGSNEVCLPEGLCADEVTARTSCRRKCSRASDCRAGYECLELMGFGFCFLALSHFICGLFHKLGRTGVKEMAMSIRAVAAVAVVVVAVAVVAVVAEDLNS
ncbi:MAG: hypothetical protein AAF614_37600, partial [Chloroflexota bacterium]